MRFAPLLDEVTQPDITRYGHAMAVPVPNPDGQIGLQPSWYVHDQLLKTERLRFAHSD